MNTNNNNNDNNKMFKSIFVTVGNGEFNLLIKEIDRLKKENKIFGKVIIQIGRGTYEPKNCEFFRFAPTLDQYYKQATFVICHGGPGTVFEILRKKIPLIALANKNRTDPMHQVEFLEGISAQTDALLYCPEVEKLEEFLNIAKHHDFIPYKQPECNIHKIVNEFLDQIDKSK